MDKSTSILDIGRESTKDALTDVLRSGAQKLLLAAVEEELEYFLKEYSFLCLSYGRLAVVRNGRLPVRTIQSGIGNIGIQVPKVWDRIGSGIKFNSALLPPYLKRTKSMEELLHCGKTVDDP